MITKTKNRLAVSRPLSVFKIVKGFLQPVLILFMIICGLLSFLEPKEGSNSQKIAQIVFLLTVAAIAFLKFIDNSFGRKSESYRTYQPAILSRFQPSIHLPLILTALFVLVPLYITVINSFKHAEEANLMDFTWFPQQGFTMEAYERMGEAAETIYMSIGQSFLNSVLYAIPPCTVGLFTAAASAFMFAKYNFKGKKTMWSVMVMTTLMPGCVTMATTYLLYDKLGFLGTPAPLIVPGMFGAVSIVMYLHGFFSAISDSLLEAAEIDGAGKIRQFFSIMLPLAKPALIAQFILTFIGQFNDILGPMLYISEPSMQTIQFVLTQLGNTELGAAGTAAANVCALVPMLLIYIIAQKQILKNISMSAGVKA